MQRPRDENDYYTGRNELIREKRVYDGNRRRDGPVKGCIDRLGGPSDTWSHTQKQGPIQAASSLRALLQGWLLVLEFLQACVLTASDGAGCN